MASPGDDLEGLPELLKGIDAVLNGMLAHLDGRADETSAPVSPEWEGFLEEHQELRPQPTDDEVLEALAAAVDERDMCQPTRPWVGRAFSSCVASQLFVWPTRAEVARVAKALGRLEKQGRVRCERPRFQNNRWSLSDAS